jgi:putative spermidine/putrescine transport system ATP-binding protein
MSKLVELQGIKKSYGRTVALEHIDLDVYAGEFLTLLGPSGSGKTTLLNLVAGMLMPTEGRIIMKGRNVTDVPSAQRGLGMVFQNYALFPHMTIFENVAFPLRVRRLPKVEIEHKVKRVLDLVKLSEMGDRKPKELSGGQQQRISIARCLVYDPPVILMDEPLGALDKHLRQQMQMEISRLHRSLGITILYVTHDQEEALTMSDRICVMDHGRVAQIGDAQDLYFNPGTRYIASFLGDSNFLPARVQTTGEVTRLSGPGGAMIEAVRGSGLVPGMDVVVLVRPESLQPTAPAERANCLTGEVEEVTFVGGMTTLDVKIVDSCSVRVKLLTDRQSIFEVGQKISVSFRHDAARIFPT